MEFWVWKCVLLAVFGQVLSIYVPNEIDQTPKRYTTGIKIKTSHYKSLSEPYYHSNYSKVYHNKNYTSSLLDSTSNINNSTSNVQSTKLYPIYISEDKKEKIQNVLTEHNTNVVEKDTLNNRVVYKRRIEKAKSIEVYNTCPAGLTGQFVYDLSCNQYLDCWNGRGSARNCAPGTLFNPKTLECDFPEKVECLTGHSANSLTIQKSSKYQNQEQAKCPKDFSGLIPNYNDCTKYIQCNSGIQTAGTCPPGTLFDTNLNVCNHPREATCFSGQSGTSYVVKEQSGGSADMPGQYYNQNRQYQSVRGQSQIQSQYQGLSQQFAGQYGKQQTYSVGQGQSGTVPNFGQGTQYYSGSAQTSGCNPQTQNCQQGIYNPTFSQTNFGTGQSQGSGGTVYIQYVMCNPATEDCSSFQQGTFMLGPGGTLCNPIKQNCTPSTYVPSNKMHQQITPNTLPSSGTYYVKYVMCNSRQEDCTKYQQGLIEATYGVPGTLIGAHPVQDSFQGSRSEQIPSECDPQIHNCGTIQYYNGQGQICNPQYQNCGQFTQSNVGRGSGVYSQDQNRPQGTTYNQIFSGQGQPGQICNPRYQNCGQDAQSNIGGGYGTYSPGQGFVQPDSQGRYPKKFNSSTNYKKICNAGEENCYQTGSITPTKTHGIQRVSATEAKCPEGFQGITKHPTNCKKFLNCANGITYVQDCAPGTLFNPILSVCDFPYNVDCKDDNDEAATTVLPEFDDQQDLYGKIPVRVPPKIVPYCQGSQCAQNQGAGQNQGFINTYGQTNCQGSQCRQTQFGQGQGQYQGQYANAQHGQIGGNYGQQPSQSSCQGLNCVNQLQGQGQYNPFPGQGGVYNNQPACQGFQCVLNPQGGSAVNQYPGQNCQGNQCQTSQVHQGYATPSPQGQGIGGNYPGYTTCQGQQCRSRQGQYPVDGQGQTEDYGYQTTLYEISTQRTYPRPTQGYGQPSQFIAGQNGGNRRSDDESHIMKIPTKPRYPGVTPINKSDRVTSGGFNNQKPVDYVDIFDPNESRNFAFATTTRKPTQKPEKQIWPPPYPDLVATDLNADYVFEYEDGEPVTLAPEKINIEKRKKSRCDANDFVCDKKSCVAKNFVCDNVRDCDDGKDEKYCQKYLDEFKPYKNARLDVLERQRWDNVSYATCALLCMDNQRFECKSFNYRKIDKVCFLTNENIGSSGALKNYYPCDYYERKSTSLACNGMHVCPNGKCLTSDQVCDGYDDCGDRADEKGCRASDFGYKVRLAGSKEENEGRVEVTVFGRTGYICDDHFSITAANVLCNELGFELGAAEVKGNSLFAKDLKENHTLYMMDDVECIGNETSIMHCNFAGWGIHNCGDNEIAGVICKTPEETCSEGYWKCDTGNECVRLPFLCDDLDDCTDNSDEASHHCNSPTELRLVNGTKGNEGRLEIRHHGVWGSICDDDFNEDAAKIACRHFGYSGSAYVKKDAYFGQSNGPIWLDQVSCFGNETSIEKCTHWEWGDHNCDHSEDVGIICSNEVDAERSSKSFAGGVSDNLKHFGTGYPSPEPVNCGYRKDNIFLEGGDVHFRVVQGSIARPGDYPWQAALRIKGHEKTAHWCGAVVIASRWILTAAHCLEGYPKGSYVVVAGEYNMDEEEGTEQQAFIEEYYIHENFRKGHKMSNDIALIKLKGKGFKLNQDIQPICLPDETANYERDLNCTISGFGTIQTGKLAYSHKLRAAWIPVQKIDVCKMAHIYGEAIREGMICAGDINGGGDACDGDSGGPLACLEDGVFTLYGLTSWGQRCGYANKPGVYVKVSYYKKWIENIMKLHP